MTPLACACVRMGERASVVLICPTPTVLTRVPVCLQVVETLWSIRANHGGGYQYRLCPLEDTLTEECFKKMPMVRGGSVSRTLFFLPPFPSFFLSFSPSISFSFCLCLSLILSFSTYDPFSFSLVSFRSSPVFLLSCSFLHSRPNLESTPTPWVSASEAGVVPRRAGSLDSLALSHPPQPPTSPCFPTSWLSPVACAS